MEPQPASVSVVLAATDFSATAAAALDWAVELAKQQGARVELVHAVTLPPSMPGYVSTSGLDFEADGHPRPIKRQATLGRRSM